MANDGAKDSSGLPVGDPQSLSEVDVSVCIVTYRARDFLRDCLCSLKENTRLNYEVIVVDDGSDDGTADGVEVEFPEIRLIRLAPSGLSAARNAGVAAAKGAILAFTDDDCEPDREWLLRLRRVFATGRYAAYDYLRNDIHVILRW